MSFSDDELDLLKEYINKFGGTCWLPTNNCNESRQFFILGLVARLEAAESKECNQFHCGHATCNAWRKAAGI